MDENNALIVDDNDDIGYSNALIKITDEKILDNIRESNQNQIFTSQNLSKSLVQFHLMSK